MRLPPETWAGPVWLLLHVLAANYRQQQQEHLTKGLRALREALGAGREWNWLSELPRPKNRPELVRFVAERHEEARRRGDAGALHAPWRTGVYEFLRARCDGNGCTVSAAGGPPLRATLTASHPPPLFDWEPPAPSASWVPHPNSGNGFSTFVWGPALWWVLHLCCLRADATGDVVPVLALVLRLPELLPCGACRRNMAASRGVARLREVVEHLDQIPPRGLLTWSVLFHHEVNDNLAKAVPRPSAEEVRSRLASRLGESVHVVFGPRHEAPGWSL